MSILIHRVFRTVAFVTAAILAGALVQPLSAQGQDDFGWRPDLVRAAPDLPDASAGLTLLGLESSLEGPIFRGIGSILRSEVGGTPISKQALDAHVRLNAGLLISPSIPLDEMWPRFERYDPPLKGLDLRSSAELLDAARGFDRVLRLD